MADSTSRDDIRKLLKTFGIKADEAVIAHLALNPGEQPLRLRLILEDITDYGEEPPAEPLHLEIEGQIGR
jgi:hypothetical protein